MALLTPRFSAHRAVREYTEQHYLPAATAYHLRSDNKGAMSRQMVDWQHNLEQNWVALHFGEVKFETRDGQHVFEVQVFLNDLDPQAVRVETIRQRRQRRSSSTAGDEARSPTSQLIGGLRLHRDCVSGPPASGLYGAHYTALRRCCGASRSRYPLSGSVESTSNWRRT